ncbi:MULTISPECIES: amidase [Sulfitobacter]|uniref:2-amino-5-chloromuconic acid deaminase n=1 Tax=Sulfitobacter dubius TaxID=218673 RepID=A0ABY3ZIS7_9RHOB|nr:amidase [Sulfitobacter dubius]UOA14560.1 2-amino-5-chloromuconic acid deaminase [Sulfitobacter dubius]WOI29978.1 amidase [Sulfitobacter dubius]
MGHLTASDISQGLRAGKLDAVTVTEQVFDRIAEHGDDAIYIDILRDRAMVEAKAARLRYRAGLPASPLDGVPVAWKDLFDLKGRVTTVGAVVTKADPPAQADAPVIAAAHRAGIISTGTVNMTEFAYSGIGLNPHYGTPRNVHAPAGQTRSPGGSSSASGVVVSAGIVPISMGSDTGGSVRIPASFNGVVGYKTSSGRHPMAGVYPLAKSLDTIGPLAHTVADCALFDAVLRGKNAPEAQAADPGTLNFVIPDDILLNDLSPAVAENFDATVARLEAAGGRVRRISLPELTELTDLIARLGVLAGAEALVLHQERIYGAAADQMDARVVRRIKLAESMSAVDLLVLQQARARTMASTAEALGNAIVLCPTTAVTAMETTPLEADQDAFFRANGLTLRNTSLGNFLDWCGVSIPNGTDADGMPTGFLLSASSGQDTALLAAALGCEEIIRG